MGAMGELADHDSKQARKGGMPFCSRSASIFPAWRQGPEIPQRVTFFASLPQEERRVPPVVPGWVCCPFQDPCFRGRGANGQGGASW